MSDNKEDDLFLHETYLYLQENEVLRPWLSQSLEKNKDSQKPLLDHNIITIVMYSCEKLDVERAIFFMSVDLLGSYISKNTNDDLIENDPILVIVMIIFISSKLIGRRSNLSQSIIIDFLHKCGLREYKITNLQKIEIDVIKKLNYDLPLSSTLDDMNLLVAVLIKPIKLIPLFQKHAKYLLNLFFINANKITQALDEIFTQNWKFELLQHYYLNKLFIPAGILLSLVSFCKSNSYLDNDYVKNNISEAVKIPYENLKIFGDLLYEHLFLIIKNGATKTDNQNLLS